MKFATLVLMLSAVSFPAVHAEDAITRNSPLAPMSQVKANHQPSSPCTPIGLTANGDIVFPWECRETIERQRGPISINVPAVSNDAPLREVRAARDARPEETVAVAAPASPAIAAPVEPSVSPQAASVAPAPAKPHSHGHATDVHHRDRQVVSPQHATVGGAVRGKKKDVVALQHGGSQK